jgi:hypothetical protein
VLDRYGHLLSYAEERVTNALDSRGRAGAAIARDAIVLEFPREERANNDRARDASRPPRPAVPALTWSNAVGLAGIEPATSSLSGMRSNRLSYSPGEAKSVPGASRSDRGA